MVVFGVLALLASLGLLAGGGGLIWAMSAKADDDGYLSTGTHRSTSSGYAITSKDLDVAEVPGWVLDSGNFARILGWWREDGADARRVSALPARRLTITPGARIVFGYAEPARERGLARARSALRGRSVGNGGAGGGAKASPPARTASA